MHIRKRSQLGKAFARVYSTGAYRRIGKRALTFGGACMESANRDHNPPQAAFAEPMPYGYVYVGMTVDPPGRAPFVRRSAKRDEALEKLKIVAGQLEEVVRATVYRA